MLGDLLAAAVNPNVGGYMLSPAATEIEAETVRWIAEFIGYPTSAGGLLVSGGNMANFVGFFAARAAKAPWKIRAEGAAGAGGQRLRAYTSAETHTWIQKAADLSGLGTDAVRWIPTGPDLRMDLAALRKAIAADRKAGDVPFLVVGTAGSVSTGAVDDLPGIARLCKEENLWFHVDGAYGGFAAALPDAAADLRALSRGRLGRGRPAQVAVRAARGGLRAGARPGGPDQRVLLSPAVLPFRRGASNFVDYGMQNSRGFRALKVWLQLKQVGRAATGG